MYIILSGTYVLMHTQSSHVVAWARYGHRLYAAIAAFVELAARCFSVTLDVRSFCFAAASCGKADFISVDSSLIYTGRARAEYPLLGSGGPRREALSRQS